ncbi:unnamed protein product [Arctogadus glacialis]
MRTPLSPAKCCASRTPPPPLVDRTPPPPSSAAERAGAQFSGQAWLAAVARSAWPSTPIKPCGVLACSKSPSEGANGPTEGLTPLRFANGLGESMQMG